MKLLKETILFAVFTALIAGLFTIMANGKSDIDTSALYGSNVDQLNRDISDQWKELEDWDADTYERQMTMIDQRYNAELIDDTARRTLRDKVNKEAYTTAVNAMNREFARADCNSHVLASNHDGLQTVISRQPGVERLPEVSQADRVYNLYRRIIQFNNQQLGLNPKFDIHEGKWSPDFPAYAANINARKTQLTSDPLYQTHLAHINDIREINRTPDRIKEASDRYYSSLYTAIENAYSSQLATIDSGDAAGRDNLKRSFNSVRAGILSETGSQSQITSKLRALYERLF